MPRRPIAIVLVFIGYLLSPVLILLQGAAAHHLPVFGQGSILTRLYFTDIIILFVYPLGALAVFSVRRWGWYLFLSCSALLIGYNLFVYSLSPRYNLLVLIIYNLALAVVAGIFFRKHVIAPYFNPRLRWWETETRYRIDISLEVLLEDGRHTGDLLDISESGCYLATETPLISGETYTLHIRCMDREAAVRGRVMRSSTITETVRGFGIMFVGLQEEEKAKIGAVLAVLQRGRLQNMPRGPAERERQRVARAPRYITVHSAELHGEVGDHHCSLLDLSRHGCLIATTANLETDRRYRMSVRCLTHEVRVNASIMRASSKDGVWRYGVSFTDLSKSERGELKKILHLLRSIGAQNRLKTAVPLEDAIIDQQVKRTPYRTILFLKRIFRDLSV
jgi:hypothetical protein